MPKWYDAVNMNRMVFFRSLVVGIVAMIGLASVSSIAKAQSNPCTAPAACMDTTDWSGPQVSANCTLPLLQCPGMQDGVYCCRPLPQNEAPADPQSNVQGAAAAQTRTAITSGGGSCSYNGVKDPFCGKSVAEIIGKIIQFLLGAAGALFLAMFVYGGATWLTAGSSDRHEQAQKTLLNAAAGILVVILSYTMVSLLVRFAGDLGVGQTDTQAVLTNEPSPSSGVGSGGASGGSSGGSFLDRLLGRTGAQTSDPVSGSVEPPRAEGGGGACSASNFITACQAACADSLVVGFVERRAECNSACTSYGPGVCSLVRTRAECPTACSAFCSSPAVGEARSFCESECPDLCEAAFR